MEDAKQNPAMPPSAQAEAAASPPAANTDPTPPPPGVSAEDQEALAAMDQLSSLFYAGNPKHAMSGVGEGLRNVATGVSMGLVSLAGATVIGAQEEGALGGVKGFGSGLAALAGLASYGAFTGLRQVGRGLYNTPEAVTQASKGELMWDSTKEAWVRVSLAEDLAELPTTDEDIKAAAKKRYYELEKEEAGAHAGAPAASDTATTGAATSAAEASSAGAPSPFPGMNDKGEVTDYYLFLGVERSATNSEIKRAFTRKALVMHPDKNPNDPDATARFQQLLQVYNVLSNEATRAEYDRTGRVDASNVQAAEVNPIEEILGVQFLEPLVGKLRFAAYFEANVMYDAAMLKELHRRRRLRIARNLCDYLDNDETGFDSASFVIRDAVATRAGPQIVTCIAESYHTVSRQHLYGSAWKRELDSWYSSKALSVSTALGLATSGARTTYRAVRGEATEEDMLAVLAAANESDIRRTVVQACRLVLYDSSVGAEARQHRAQRLEALGNLAMEEVRKELASRLAAAPVVTSAAPPADGEGAPNAGKENGYTS